MAKEGIDDKKGGREGRRERGMEEGREQEGQEELEGGREGE